MTAEKDQKKAAQKCFDSVKLDPDFYRIGHTKARYYIEIFDPCLFTIRWLCQRVGIQRPSIFHSGPWNKPILCQCVAWILIRPHVFFWCSRLFQNSFSNAKLFVGHFMIIFVFWNEYPVIILWFFSPLVFNPNQMCPNSYFIQFWMEICHFDTIHFLSFLFYKIPLLISKNEINQNTITK